VNAAIHASQVLPLVQLLLVVDLVRVLASAS
jgi:hypothetical protein